MWVTASDEPVLVKVQNVQHLATPIRAQLRRALPASSSPGGSCRGPAVGGEPGGAALPRFQRSRASTGGGTPAPVGWTDLAEDGEFCVALRCALIRDRRCALYAGWGIVRDSLPDEELAENEVKLQALLPLLS